LLGKTKGGTLTIGLQSIGTEKKIKIFINRLMCKNTPGSPARSLASRWKQPEL